jgi:hypothetical protein
MSLPGQANKRQMVFTAVGFGIVLSMALRFGSICHEASIKDGRKLIAKSIASIIRRSVG